MTFPGPRLPGRTSPPDQPRWAHPALFAIAAAAAGAYAWRLGSSTEIFYAAADRSMSASLHNFFFAAFDPAATISLDKLPGAFWFQALSIQLFGANTRAVALPQVIEGVLTVLVLYRAVRRCAGTAAGLVAAGVLAVAPATVTLDRGNVADSLLVLLLVLAANALVSALQTGKRVHLVLAGMWVGLAFQAKMLEAWAILPALALTFLFAGRGGFLQRIGWTATMLAVAVVVSLSWMAAVSLTPRTHRPYVDGTTNDSPFSQVFDYNGFGRVHQNGPNQVLGRTLGIPFLAAPPPRPSATQLLRGAPGRDTGWLLPATAVAIPALLWTTRRRPRTDLQRAAVLLWGTLLVTFALVFSVSAINYYYLGALSPPIAALMGIGASATWAHRRARSVQLGLAAIVVASVTYALLLTPAAGTGRPTWLVPAAATLAAAALGAIIVFALTTRFAAAVTMAIAAGVAITLVPLVASTSVVTNDLGVFDTPFQPAAVTAFTRSFFGAPLRPIATLPTIERARDGAPDLLAAQTSVLAAPFIFATGQEALPLGGYDGAAPFPSLDDLRRAIARGQFHLVLTAPHSHDPRVQWIKAHCLPVHATGSQSNIALDISYCLPTSAH